MLAKIRAETTFFALELRQTRSSLEAPCFVHSLTKSLLLAYLSCLSYSSPDSFTEAKTMHNKTCLHSCAPKFTEST